MYLPRIVTKLTVKGLKHPSLLISKFRRISSVMPTTFLTVLSESTFHKKPHFQYWHSCPLPQTTWKYIWGERQSHLSRNMVFEEKGSSQNNNCIWDGLRLLLLHGHVLTREERVEERAVIAWWSWGLPFVCVLLGVKEWRHPRQILDKWPRIRGTAHKMGAL